MIRKISTFYADGDKGHATVSLDLKREMYQIDYYDNNGRHFFMEEFPNKTMRYVEDAAENWALGIKKLEDEVDEL